MSGAPVLSGSAAPQCGGRGVQAYIPDTSNVSIYGDGVYAVSTDDPTTITALQIVGGVIQVSPYFYSNSAVSAYTTSLGTYTTARSSNSQTSADASAVTGKCTALIRFQFAFDKTIYTGILDPAGQYIQNIANGTGQPGLEPNLVAQLKTNPTNTLPNFPPIVYECDEYTHMYSSSQFDESKWRYIIILLIVYVLYIHRP